jgi:hypothetical protein
VLDARSAFGTLDRFGHADRLQVGWPADALPDLHVDESTYIVVLTHDEKIDDPALLYACRSPARYIGALGSKRTHATPRRTLARAGPERSGDRPHPRALSASTSARASRRRSRWQSWRRSSLRNKRITAHDSLVLRVAPSALAQELQLAAAKLYELRRKVRQFPPLPAIIPFHAPQESGV